MRTIKTLCVGHFDRDSIRLAGWDPKCLRPIDLDRVNRLLAEYPAEVAANVAVRGGHVWCRITLPRQEDGRLVADFADRLAREENCMSVLNGHAIIHSPAEGPPILLK
jgi:hypothetical protein